MSYLDQAQNPRRRLGGLVGTIAINATIGILVVTGLRFSGVASRREYLPTFDVPTPTPPPPDPAPTPSAAAEQPFVAPLPPLPLPPQPGPQVVELDLDRVVPEVVPRPDPGPSIAPTPRPAPSFTPRAARPANNSAGWITTDDYPRASLVEGNEGTARYRVVVGTNGRVASCEVTSPTGDARLDEATCRFIARRARFEPATDETGAKVLGTYTGTVRWQIPD